MESRSKGVSDILGFIRGGNDADVAEIAKDSPELLARCIAYILDKEYHRQNTVKALIALLNKSEKVYRGSAWALIQRVPLSHLLEIHNVMTNKDNTKRLRHALASKIASSSVNEVIRAFFFAPSAYRSFFEKMYLPRDIVNDAPITNASYKTAHKLSQLSVPQAIQEFKIKKIDLVKKYGLPFEKVIDLIDDPQDALEFSEKCDSTSFFEHARWFKNIVGDEAFSRVAEKKMATLKNPLDFLAKKQHLEESGALSPELTAYLEQRATEILDDVMKKYQLERLALIVDVSGSMHAAVEITKKLYEAFSRMGSVSVTDVIAFNSTAFAIDAKELASVKVGGQTSIGSAVALLSSRIRDRSGRDVPQAIIMVTDLDENTPPMLSSGLRLLREYDNPPLIVLLVGRKYVPMEYPNAIIKVDDFHPGLVMSVMREIARITSKVAVKEREVTKTVVERRPVEEEIGSTALPQRSEESYRPGYLKRLLTTNVNADKAVIERLSS